YADGRRVVLDLATRDHAVVPGAVPGRRGFYADFNWTNGDGILDGFELRIPPGMSGLLIELAHVHPDWAHPEELHVQLVADGVALKPTGSAPGKLFFTLPAALRVIRRLEIRSSTFVPRRRGLGSDGRTLGIPVSKIELVPLDHDSG
ncbi:MAG: hypothetical protein GXP48_09075, partial [Acidobacteria bacterium]|nr:hypothetical protein [Acidobacteriota bacterium]